MSQAPDERPASTGEAPPAPSETYLLAADASGRQIVSVHVKRTYRLGADGHCRRFEGAIPLLLGPTSNDDEETFPETDVIPFKGRTDLVVMAKAWGRGARQVTAKIRVGPLELRYHVSGERRAIYRGRGSWSFSVPEPFEAVDLRYDNAYGGFDETAPEPEIAHIIDLLNLHPGAYPRNTIGKGYVVQESRERIDGLVLPNVEHPEQLLTPDRLVTGSPDLWWRQPLAWSCGWFPKLAYPRIAHFRGVPDGIPEDDREMAEVRLGWLEPGYARRSAALTLDEPMDARCADAASPALVLPFLRGDEAIELTAMTPDGRLVVQLPGERPRIQIRCLGESYELAAVPHRVLVSTLEMGVFVVWHGAWVPPVPLPLRTVGPHEGMAEALEGVESLVDGRPIAPLGAEGA